ncbi:MAG: recombination regulator RecX [Lachnospiraceae bacterium]|nr:recombination regulator RecX [Lachnospiraceae bacterium]
MTITEIREFRKGRYQIFLDGEFAFVLYRGELRRYSLREGEEIAAEDYKEILEKVLPKRAKLRCMNLLQSKSYTEKQLRDKMRDGLYPEAAMDEAIAYLKSYHYVDDDQYAEDYIFCHMEERSRTRIEQDLMKKGISKDVTREAFQRLEDKGTVQDETIQIRQFLEKKHFDPENMEKKEQQKLMASLFRKGFSADKIKQVFRFYESDY